MRCTHPSATSGTPWGGVVDVAREHDAEAVESPGAHEGSHSATGEAWGSDESSALLLARDRCIFFRRACLHSMALCACHRPEDRLPMRAASRCAAVYDSQHRMTGVLAGSLHAIAVLVVLPMHGWIIAAGRATMLGQMTIGRRKLSTQRIHRCKCAVQTVPWQPEASPRSCRQCCTQTAHVLVV